MINDPNFVTEEDFIAFLSKHGIDDYKIKNDEILFPCPFNNCDKDCRRNEDYHCSFNISKCVFQCFKCGEVGNYIILRKFFNEPVSKTHKEKTRTRKKSESLDGLAIKFNQNLPDKYRKYLHDRGINNASIERFLLGYGYLFNSYWITIPIFGSDGKVKYFKLRNPDDGTNSGPKYIVYPRETDLELVGAQDLEHTHYTDVLICEGEFDRIMAIQNGAKVPVVTAGGAKNFRSTWAEYFKYMRNIYICMDNDDAGRDALRKITSILENGVPNATIYSVHLPVFVEHADISDYFNGHHGTIEELFSKYSKRCGGIDPIDLEEMDEMSIDDLARILDSTIKFDDANKVITFLAMLLAYTESDQLNVIFNSSSSTGKTYICSEVGKYFPENDLKMYGKITPTAFYYNESLTKTDVDTKQSFIDLERKILIFSEQPNPMLLENLRSFLSHDAKKTVFSNTNKGKNGANSAKDGYILGFASTFFCSANLRIDEQEQTRCLILSPENTESKISAGINMNVKKGCDHKQFNLSLDENLGRQLLKDRILYIKGLGVDYINIEDPEYLENSFRNVYKILTPRAQRDIVHFISLVKGVALLNAMYRIVDGKIVATNFDVDEAVKLWSTINESIQCGVPPETLDIYKRFILPAYYELNEGNADDEYEGITLRELSDYYYEHTGKLLNMDFCKRMHIPNLQAASMITYEKCENDKRKMIITPIKFFNKQL